MLAARRGLAVCQLRRGCEGPTVRLASLNSGDCFSYALAKATGEPLLFTGDDFARTDITRAA